MNIERNKTRTSQKGVRGNFLAVIVGFLTFFQASQSDRASYGPVHITQLIEFSGDVLDFDSSGKFTALRL